jgi:hypothetical protein
MASSFFDYDYERVSWFFLFLKWRLVCHISHTSHFALSMRVDAMTEFFLPFFGGNN